MRILILGGTTEARAVLAGALALGRHQVVYSLAGRTDAPVELPTHPDLTVRTGGFGGASGLADFLRAHAIDLVIDATHPFARQISENAVAATGETGTRLVVCGRPAWRPGPGDDWTEVADHAEAAEALGSTPRRVFLTVGRLGLAAYRRAPQHWYLVRTIDRPADADMPENAELILARGPFEIADESALMRTNRIDVLVTKNSGGEATRAKLVAARDLGIPVVLIGRQASRAPVRSVAGILADLRSDVGV